MAVTQVDRLKNPCRVWTWNNSVAAQPPPSAPAMPIRQVRMRPCDLLPGITMLASSPAPRPRMIQAMMPIPTPFVSDVRGCAGVRVVGFAGSAHPRVASVASHDPPQLGDPGGSGGGHHQGARDGGEE